MVVQLFVLGEGVVGEDSGEVAESLGPLEAAELAVGIVAGHAVLTTALHVHRSQIRTKVGLGLAEKMVRQLVKKEED